MALANHRYLGLRLVVVLGLICAFLSGQANAGDEPAAPPEGEIYDPPPPPGTEISEGFYVYHLSTWSIPESTTPEGVERTGYVSVVTVQPGVAAEGTNSLGGWFALEVRSGAICYSLVELLDPTTTVSVQATASDIDPLSCAADGTPQEDIRVDCVDGVPCQLAAGDVVLLPAGSILVQTGGVEHTYRNASDSATALVVLTGYKLELPDGVLPNCGGTCWRW